jgi:DNA-binding transcriptional regulator YhcF (GntR family)
MKVPDGAQIEVCAIGKLRPAKVAGLQVPEHIVIIRDMIVNAAERGDECPSNRFLTTATGRGVQCVIDAVHFLETAGVLRFQRGRQWRIATVVASGKSTRAPGAAGREARSILRREKIGNLAELMAEEIPIKKAAEIMGISPASATSLAAEIRRDLGWQAI